MTPRRPRAEPALPLEPLGDLAWVQFAQPLELDRPAQTDDRRGFPSREPEPLELHRRAAREAFRRRWDAEGAVRLARPPDQPALDLPRLRRGDQLAADRANERLRHGAEADRPLARKRLERPSQHRVVGEPLEELRVVGLERKRREQLLQRLLRVRPKLDAPVGLLPCAGSREPVLDREEADEDAPVEPPSGVARPHRGVAQREGAAGAEGRLDHGGNITGDSGRLASRPVRTVRPMGRVELTGWASTQRIGTDGTVDSEQRVTLDRPVVECSDRGARELASRYWAELQRSGRRLMSVREHAGGIDLRLLGFGPVLIALGPVETAYSPASATREAPDPRRAARPAERREHRVRAGRRRAGGAAVEDRRLPSASRAVLRARPAPVPPRPEPEVLSEAHRR